MKKTLSLLLVLVMVLSLCSVTAFAAENYTGKTVILYTANVRGDVDVYAKVAAAKTAYESAGADVILADAGNFLQGTAAVNSDRGLGVYNLMDAAGYDVAAMGLAEFGYADATTGYGYHKNITKYYTQAELQNGAEALTYNKDMKGEVTADRAEKAAATFTALSANAVSDTEYYSFEASTVLTKERPEGRLLWPDRYFRSSECAGRLPARFRAEARKAERGRDDLPVQRRCQRQRIRRSCH